MLSNQDRHRRRGGVDYRIICDCQLHPAREQRLWRRSLPAAQAAVRQFRSGGIALLIGLPLALGTMGIPGEAMNTAQQALRPSISTASNADFAIFTTARMRREFLEPQAGQRSLTLEVAKEQFFRTRIPYGSIIYREAVRNNLAPELVAAVVEAESDFRVRLVSGRNAQGLMQIVPSTGRDLGVDDLFDPDENIAAGTRYLRYLVDRFGDPRVALAAYNAGEGNVEKFGGIPPFPETLAYLDRVNERVHLYRARVRDASLSAGTSYGH